MKKQTFIKYRVFFVSLITLCLTSACFGVIFGHRTNKSVYTSVQNTELNVPTIIIDAGHGGEDGGAVGVTGVLEKNLNLSIALKLKYLFELTDLQVVMTRMDDKLLYNDGQESRKKFYDVKNRVDVISQYEKPIFISIHQNKFPIEKYSGLQVYYSDTENSESIAESVRENNRLYLQKENNRQCKKAGKSIYVLNKASCPAVLIECGFLSNRNEERMLCSNDYQRKLAFVIYKSIIEYTTDAMKGQQ